MKTISIQKDIKGTRKKKELKFAVLRLEVYSNTLRGTLFAFGKSGCVHKYNSGH